MSMIVRCVFVASSFLLILSEGKVSVSGGSNAIKFGGHADNGTMTYVETPVI